MEKRLIMGTIHIVGLGPGDAGLITLSAFRLMQEAGCLLLRTAVHPSVSMLDEAHIAYEALDRFYDQGISFDCGYLGICFCRTKRRQGLC